MRVRAGAPAMQVQEGKRRAASLARGFHMLAPAQDGSNDRGQREAEAPISRAESSSLTVADTAPKSLE